MGFARINFGPSVLAHFHLIFGQESGKFLNPLLHLAVNFSLRIRVDYSDMVIAELPFSWLRQAHLPAHLIDIIGTGHHIQCYCKIIGTARQRSHCSDVGFGDCSRQGLALGRDNAVSRLVAINAAVMCRIADRRADIAASFKAGQPGGKRCS